MANLWRTPLSLALLFSMTAATAATAIAGGEPGQTGRVTLADAAPVAAHTDLFVVDNVSLALTSRLRTTGFVTSRAGSPNQGASSFTALPYRMVHVAAVPYGFSAPSEDRWTAAPGLAARLTSAVRSPDVTASIFGRTVSGQTTLLPDRDDPTRSTYLATASFATEAGSRVWLVTIAQQLPGGAQRDAAMRSFVHDALQGLALDSDTLGRPTTRQRESWAPKLPVALGATASSARVHPMNYTGWSIADPPGWWTNAPCDSNYYYAHTGTNVPNAYRLSPTAQVPNPWHGLESCGPQPFGHPERDVAEYFYSGAYQVLEWECVELSMRWMWQAYGVQPYSANGNTIASNYSSSRGGNVVYVYNGYSAPLPVMGDVLQYSGGTNGHTSVVVSESHNSSGNGGLYVMEQNDGPSAGDYLSESNWHVNCSAYNGECPTAWLHRP